MYFRIVDDSNLDNTIKQLGTTFPLFFHVHHERMADEYFCIEMETEQRRFDAIKKNAIPTFPTILSD